MNHLRKIRKQKGVTQKELIDKLNIKQQRYNHYELGRRELPVSLAKEIGKILNIDWWKLYE